MNAKGITVRISTAEWINPAIERIAKMGEDLVELGVPIEVAQQACESAAQEVAGASVQVSNPRQSVAGFQPEGLESRG